MKPTKQARRKRCSECGELKPADDVIGRQKICGDCEEGMHYCSVCDEWMHDECRHICWSDGGYHVGCGATDVDAEYHKDSFQRLMRLFASMTCSEYAGDGKYIEKPLLPKLLAEIEANNFWTQWHGPMIGGPPDLALKHDFRPDCPLDFHDIRSDEQESWGGR